LVREHRPAEIDTIKWYWKTAGEREPGEEYHRESVPPFTVHSGPLKSVPLPLLAICMDSQIKTYMDRDALGDAVRPGGPRVDPEGQDAFRTARGKELARRMGGESLQGDVQVAIVEYNGYAVSGMMVNTGKRDETVAAIIESPTKRAAAMAALQARYTLPPGDPFLEQKENEIVDLIRYFRTPDQLLKEILPADLVQRPLYRRTVQLIRALALSEAFATTKRWMKREGRAIKVGVVETPNEDVKLLVEGKKVKAPDGREIRVGGIPHRVLIVATGVELYPVAFENRPEGTTKTYTLYAIDFGAVALHAKKYREHAIAAYRRARRSAVAEDQAVRR
jgi:hypothetical protein